MTQDPSLALLTVGWVTAPSPSLQNESDAPGTPQLRCSEELLGLVWLCLPLKHKMLPLPDPTPCSQPASLLVEGWVQRRCCPRHSSTLVFPSL